MLRDHLDISINALRYYSKMKQRHYTVYTIIKSSRKPSLLVCTKHVILVWFESLHSCSSKSSVFWDITSCSPLKLNKRFRGIYVYVPHLQGWRVGWASNQLAVSFTLACASTMKMVVTCSSKTSVDFQQTTWHHISENRTLYFILFIFSHGHEMSLFVCSSHYNVW
jgi:hypothetical protein